MGAAAFLRLHQWFLPVADPDIGVYLHVAFAWLHGTLPYLRAWEYKPPGLFALYAVALRLCGSQPTIAVQGLATLATWMTALALWRLGPDVDRDDGARSGRYAALFFVLLSTENEGYLGDAEVLVAPFIAWALVLALGHRRTLSAALGTGLLCGAAVQMKLTALPLVIPPFIALLRTTRRPVAALGVAAAATLAPFGVEAVVYAHAQAFGALWDANVSASLRRVLSLHRGVLVENLAWIPRQLRVLAPALEFAPLAFGLRGQKTVAFGVTWGWLIAAAVAVAGAGEFYDRHFVLIEPPLALLGAIGLRVLIARSGLRSSTLATLVFIATFALHAYWETAQAAGLFVHRVVLRDRTWREPEYDRIFETFRRLDKNGGSVYLVQLTPLLYDAWGRTAPTRFADSDLLLEDRMATMTGVGGRRELARIFASKPTYVIVGGPQTESRFDRGSVAFIREQLHRAYRRRTQIDGAVIYQRRSAPPTGPANR